MDEKIKAMQNQIQEYENIANSDAMTDTEFEQLAEMLLSFAEAFDTMPIEQKRSAIRAFIKKIVWDGENVHIYFFGTPEDEIDLSDAEETEPHRRGCK